eukprot:scaffold12533_cov71-Skeletonema_dohrnii-CCMP3373.AAC.2
MIEVPGRLEDVYVWAGEGVLASCMEPLLLTPSIMTTKQRTTTINMATERGRMEIIWLERLRRQLQQTCVDDGHTCSRVSVC